MGYNYEKRALQFCSVTASDITNAVHNHLIIYFVVLML